MIALISGQIASVTIRSVVVETGGVGYEVQCTKDTVARLPIGSEVRFLRIMWYAKMLRSYMVF